MHHYLVPVIFPASLVGILAASEIGRWLGIRASGQGRATISGLQATIFGLLALMIGFTFSMALTRFEARRDAVLTEANAIATTALRARLLPSPYNTETLDLLREYLRLRIEISQFPSAAELTRRIVRSNALQEKLWQQAIAGVSAEPDSSLPSSGIFQALNDMFTSQQRRIAIFHNQIPTAVLIALYGIALVATAFAGYTSSQEERTSRFPIYLTGILICFVILLIQDLEFTDTGLISVSQQPLIDTANIIATY